MHSKFGIYAIVGPNGRLYVGSTTRNFYDRLCAHMSTLRKSKHSSILLQRAWDKYGDDAFEFKILEELQMPEDCIPREIVNIQLLKSTDPQFGYNIAQVVDNRLGHTQSLKTKEKISIKLKGTKKPDGFGANLSKQRLGEKNPMYGRQETKEHAALRTQNNKKVIIRSDGIVFASLQEAASALGVTYQNVSRVLRLGGKCRGYTFRYCL